MTKRTKPAASTLRKAKSASAAEFTSDASTSSAGAVVGPSTVKCAVCDQMDETKLYFVRVCARDGFTDTALVCLSLIFESLSSSSESFRCVYSLLS